MALEKIITANGSKGHHKFTLKVVEDRTELNSSFLSFTFVIAPISKGYDWSGWGSKISYTITIGNNTFSGTIPSYNGSSTVTLKSGSNIEIEHESDGTKTINVAFNVKDGANKSYTCGNASSTSTFTLSVLHTPPEINSVSIEEIDSTMMSLGIADDNIVQFLSKKRFTITSTFYDEATISNCSVYHNNVLIGTSSTNEVVVDFSQVNELMTTQSEGINYTGISIVVNDSMGGTATILKNYEVIKYTKPTIEKTSTTIKRKTGGGVVLTDNKANLNFVGTAYLENNTIGNNNSPVVEYKIWNDLEPINYTQVQATITGNNITISNLEISNINYTSVYNYKIRISDSFGNGDEKEGTVSTGKSVWTEYKDRVDFSRATVQGNDVLTVNDKEIIDSNSNGTFIRFQSGLQICFLTRTFNTGNSTSNLTTSGNVYYTENFWDFPAEFISPPIVTMSTLDRDTGVFAGACDQPSTTRVKFTCYGPASGKATGFSAIAIGFWK